MVTQELWRHCFWKLRRTTENSRSLSRKQDQIVKGNHIFLCPQEEKHCIRYSLYKILEEKNIPVKLVLDSAVAYALEEADMILVGAESVVETGGIINRVSWP